MDTDDLAQVLDARFHLMLSLVSLPITKHLESISADFNFNKADVPPKVWSSSALIQFAMPDINGAQWTDWVEISILYYSYGWKTFKTVTDNNPGRAKTYEIIGPIFDFSGTSGYDVAIRCKAKLSNGAFGTVKAVFSNPLFRFSEKVVETGSAIANVASVKTVAGQSLAQGADNNDNPIKAHDDVHDLSTGNKPLNINGQSNPSRTIVDIIDITNHVNFDWSWFKDKTVTMTYVSTGENLDVHVLHSFFGVEFAPKEISFSEEVSAEVVGLLQEPVEVIEHLLTQKAGVSPTRLDSRLTPSDQNIVPNGEFDSDDLTAWQPELLQLEVVDGQGNVKVN